MPAADIFIKGAREHNLRNIDLAIPRNQLVCLTGVSGSGKSSLAFDTLFAEGQRRYIESLSSFARQFLGQMPKPDLDQISGLSPSISISQKSAGTNPRSTVGTITQIQDYLRVLFARVATGHCPRCQSPITAQTREQILQQILAEPPGSGVVVLAPVIRGQRGEYRDLFQDLSKQGFLRARVDGRIVKLTDDLKLDRQMRHDIEVVTDRLPLKPGLRSRLGEAVDVGLKLGRGSLLVLFEPPGEKDTDTPVAAAREVIFSVDYACTRCGVSFEPPTPQLFSFNSPQGMCLSCDGLGTAFTLDAELLVPHPDKSFKQGCIEPLGRWAQLGRWRRHIFQGVADTVERQHQLAPGTLLGTPWRQLSPQWQAVWLSGTGDQHITFTWRGGRSPIKYGGTFRGIIPELLEKYRTSRSPMQLRQLEKYMRTQRCPDCHGERLNPQARAARLTTRHPFFSDAPARTLPEVCQLPISEAVLFFSELELDATRQLIAREVIKEVRGRLGFLLNVGLDYLTLERTAPTLSGGESQRIRLAGQIGCGLVGVLYILDEPSIGLHPRDNHRLLQTLQHLRDLGNTVVVVEHDEETMRHSDHIIDFGPGPGVRGGEIVACGSVAQVSRSPRSVTGQYLSGRRSIPLPTQRRDAVAAPRLTIHGARHNNLKQIDVAIPLGLFVCVTGVSGSGKSSLVNDILVKALHRDLNRGTGEPGVHDRIEGWERLDKLIAIDQSPIGRTPRSNPATYIKVFDDIRRLFSQMPDAKRRGYQPGRFSFNVEGGRCQACDGNGSNRLEMDFLADVWVTCPVCNGHRFNRETLSIRFKDCSIADILEMDVQQALERFENIPQINHKLRTLHDVGLDYLKLGQPSPTLSGGEAQRIKLARELVKRSTGRTLYLLDEPTTGLHFADVQLLLQVLHSFVDAGNTVLVVEHNLDVIKTADWLIDLGPEGGAAGGWLVTQGLPEEVARHSSSHTGAALARLFGPPSATRRRPRPATRKAAASTPVLRIDGARQHNLKDVSLKIPREQMTVFCGPSGSGKSSLAMDTIYAEGQRRYVESLSAYARQFVGQMQKPELEHIDGLSPAIAIEQQNLGNTPRSTVGTTTEIYDYLRVLMARLATPYCPDCDLPIGTQTSDEVINKVMSLAEGTRAIIMAPVLVDVGQSYDALWDDLRTRGYLRVRVDGRIHTLDQVPEMDRRQKHDVQVVVDRVVIRAAARGRIAESCEVALSLGQGVLHLAIVDPKRPEQEWTRAIHSQHLACDACGRSFDTLTPHSFSFNSHLGWCPQCNGLGTQVGANPAALLRDPQATLADGALLLWPDLAQPVARLMLEALAARLHLPLDVPWAELSARHRRWLLHGTGDTWFEVFMPGSRKKAPQPVFRFQFKGLYPALEEAARLSPALRTQLNHLVAEVECSACAGSRLRDDASAARFRNQTVDQLCRLPLGKLQRTMSTWKLTRREKEIAGELLREIGSRVQFLNDVGLDYLTLHRPANSLSGGEAQRIRLASQLGSGLCGVLYVLDEPTIGLHPRDNLRLLRALRRLRDLGNTLVLVEHDREVLSHCDQLVDFGPGAGSLGGEIVAQGSPDQLARRRASVTGPYLSGRRAIPIPANRRPVHRGAPSRPREPSTDWLRIRGARHHNLRSIDVEIPLACLVAVTGPSGSGKSSLIEDVLYPFLAVKLHRAVLKPGLHEEILGAEHINKVIRVDQQPLGNSPASNPATFTGVFDLIRELYAQLPDARLRGYTARRFSFNVPGGRCDACEGHGQRCIEMHFLADVWVPCDTCRGERYNPDTLQVQYHGRTIADILRMTCGDALRLFENIPKIGRILQTLCDVGLDYLTLGQSAPTLSGGEAQRVKLAAELARPDTGRTLYLLDEPTTGLHFGDLERLLAVLHRLVDLGNSVLVIEHNLDLIKSADWVIDIGPEAGDEGGQVVAAGTPEEIVAYATQFVKTLAKDKDHTSRPVARASRQASNQLRVDSSASPGVRCHTGEALAAVLAAGPHEIRKPYDPQRDAKRLGPNQQLEIEDVGKGTSMPWETDGRRWHTRDRVGRRGEPCRWDGRILEAVVDRIHELGGFEDTHWNSRTIVEIAVPRKDLGWFLHALTGETWLLKLKFRVPRRIFQCQELQQRLALKTLNELDDLPAYGNEPRVRCKRLPRGGQEIEVRLHSWAETDTPAFWQFLETAVQEVQKTLQRKPLDMEALTPWRVLGEKWHFLPKGFPPGTIVEWSPDLLKELCRLLEQAAPGGQFVWHNQQVVHYLPTGQMEPWASIFTKRPEHLGLTLYGPPGCTTLGRFADLGRNCRLDLARGKEVVRIDFKHLKEIRSSQLKPFLEEHHAGVVPP